MLKPKTLLDRKELCYYSALITLCTSPETDIESGTSIQQRQTMSRVIAVSKT